jgi:hypothetical protein
MGLETPARPLAAYDRVGDILDVVEGFRDRSLPATRWTHQAHLTVGLWHVLNRPPAAVLEELRRGIIAYNESVGTVNDDKGGYHETITAFYVWAIGKFAKDRPGGSGLLALTNELLASRYAAKTYPFEYYSRERLLCVAARRAWLDPDLRPLE